MDILPVNRRDKRAVEPICDLVGNLVRFVLQPLDGVDAVSHSIGRREHLMQERRSLLAARGHLNEQIEEFFLSGQEPHWFLQRKLAAVMLRPAQTRLLYHTQQGPCDPRISVYIRLRMPEQIPNLAWAPSAPTTPVLALLRHRLLCCPDCSCPVVHASGCHYCPACGWSACS